MRSHKKFGPDRFSCFDVYWIQKKTKKNTQTDKQSIYIDKRIATKNLRKIVIANLHFLHLPKVAKLNNFVIYNEVNNADDFKQGIRFMCFI